MCAGWCADWAAVGGGEGGEGGEASGREKRKGRIWHYYYYLQQTYVRDEKRYTDLRTGTQHHNIEHRKYR